MGGLHLHKGCRLWSHSANVAGEARAEVIVFLGVDTLPCTVRKEEKWLVRGKKGETNLS